MTDPELTRRAKAAGVAPCYLDWRGEQVDVSDDTLAAILDALGEPDERDACCRRRRRRRLWPCGRAEAPPPRPPGLGVHSPALLGPVPGIVGARRPA